MTDQNEYNRQEKLYVDKEVAFYAASINAWLGTRMERSRQVLTLSSAALGFLMIFYKDLNDVTSFVIWMLAAIFFIATIFILLKVLSMNGDYLEEVVANSPCHEAASKRLKRIADTASFTFAIGIILAFCLGIYQSDFSLIKNESQEVQHEQQQVQ